MRKKILAGAVVVGLILALALLAGCGSSGALPANVQARVGKTEITKAQFDTELAIFKGVFSGQAPDEKTKPAEFKNFEAYVLDQMVTYEIAKQKASAYQVSVTDQEVQDHIAALKKSSFSDDQTKFDAALKASNLTLAQLETYTQQLLLIQKMYAMVTKAVTTVPDADVSAYYDAHKASFYQPETRAVRHILISVSAPSSSSSSASSTTTVAPDAAQWAAALAKAEKVRQDLVGGADWKTEAAQYSDDPGTKDKGGALGTFAKGKLVAAFDDAAFSLALNDLSQPIKTVYGYHIIQVTAINPGKQGTLADAKKSITTTLLGDAKKAVWNDWLKKTKTELEVVIAPGMELTTTTTTVAPVSNTTVSSTDTTAAGETTTAKP